MPPVGAQLAAWSRGIADELQFWNRLMATAGGQWPEDWRSRMDPATPLDAAVAGTARALCAGTAQALCAGPALELGQAHLRILDVGAGPLTSLGFVLPGVALEILPVDPLAAAYAALFARHGMAPPIPTRFAPAEDLALFLPPGSFDLAHCRNALDHSWDPLRGIEQMLAMVRVGGRVLLRHFADEAEREAYSGFHQFNFTERGGRFVIWNREVEIDVAAALVTPARLSITGGEFICVEIEKTGPSPVPAAAEAQGRLAASLEALIAALAMVQLPD